MKNTLIRDLLTTDAPSVEARGDICIIGAGAAGIYLATQLAAKGLDVILLEAGGSVCTDSAGVGFEALFTDLPYQGATKGRAFGLGGTTSAWGGLLVPHSRHDLGKRTSEGCDPWDSIVLRVEKNSDHVLKTLGYSGAVDFTDFGKERLPEIYESLHAGGLDLMANLFLPFRKKNLAFLLDEYANSCNQLKVFTNAVVTSWEWAPASDGKTTHLCKLSAVAHNGNRLVVVADRFIVAAGAIESARILLEINAQSLQPVTRPSAAIGSYLADHLSISIADVAEQSRHSAITLFGPRFLYGWMRSFRFVEADPPSAAPKVFAHFIFENEDPGFHLAKEVLTAVQANRLPSLTFDEVSSGIIGIGSLAFARYLRSTLYIPRNTKSHLQLDLEQLPAYSNRLTLAEERDRFGRPKTIINWQISKSDLNEIQSAAERMLQKWPGIKGGLPELVPLDLCCNSSKPHDAFHPVGTCRMGNDSEAVTDTQLKVWGLSNLWVVSTGVLPSAGTANPTFTMLCLANALIDELVKAA